MKVVAGEELRNLGTVVSSALIPKLGQGPSYHIYHPPHIRGKNEGDRDGRARR